MIQNQPTGNPRSFTFIKSFRPTGSQTVVWAQNMKNGQMYYMLKWGNDIYLPVGIGDEIGIGIYNGSGNWRAYPIYIEGLNLWDGGPSEPEDCTPQHMWEMKPGQRMIAKELMNPDAQLGRPLIITESGLGYAVGEASFGTTAYRGQIRVYEKLPLGGGFQSFRPENVGHAERGSDRTVRGGPDMFGAKSLGMGRMKAPQAAIGAGAEQYVQHSDTGMQYQRNAQPVIYLRVETRADLQDMLNNAWGTGWNWFWPIPAGSGFWWDEPWAWKPKPTHGHIPIAPHKGR